MMAPALVIFDCDGVLVDSELLSAQMVIEVFAEIGITVDLPFVYQNFVGHSFTTVAANYARQYGRNVPANFVDDYRQRLLQSFDGNLKPMAHIQSVLDHLQTPVCIATGSSPTRVAKSLAVTNLSHYFSQNIFSTTQVKHGKPSPDIFLYAARAMNTDPRNCLVIEDSTAGVKGAKAAGMACWHFTGGTHFNHGYQHVPKPPLVDREFSSMLNFFDGAPELRRN
jgi:HAD superfamily hydrolase (TIGR01509 family)